MKYLSTLLLFIACFTACQNSSPKEPVQNETDSGKPAAIKLIATFQSVHVGPRSIYIWTPPGYNEATKYPVIYVHDGQMLFDSSMTWNKQEWHLDETMNKLIEENTIQPAIVVGIANRPESRNAEYVPQDIFNHLPAAAKNELEKNYFKSNAASDDYLRFLVEEVKFYIDGFYPTLPDADHTFIMGSSKGGLISLYAMCEYPQVFGGAACISTDWIITEPPAGNEKSKYDHADAFRKYINENLPDPKTHRIYFDHGTATRDALYEQHQILVDTIMKAHGYTDQNWMTKKFEGDEHAENAWAKRLHYPLEFLLGHK